MARALTTRTSFAAGEISPALYGRRELGRQQIGVAHAENMVVTIEGSLTRRSGTRFVLPYKREAERGTPMRFRFSATDGYILHFNGGVCQVLKDGGFLTVGGAVYEFAHPYTEADLPGLRYQQVNNAIYITCPGYQPRVLTRSGHTSWAFSLYQPAGGPVDIQNLNTSITIAASATTGTGITLTGAGTSFTANDVGGVFRLDEPDLTKVPQWVPSEALTSPETSVSGATGNYIGDMTSGGGLAAAFNGATNTTSASCADSSGFVITGYVGTDLGGSPSRINRVRIYGSNNVGFWSGTDQTIEAKLYASNSAPVDKQNGTLLGAISFTDTGNESAGRDIYSNDALTAWRYVWLYVNIPGYTGITASICVAEMSLFKWTSATPANLRRYNGRVYAALADGDAGVNPPTHETGDALSGQFNVAWRFKHNTYGMVRVTGFTSATSLTADVISLLPDSVVSGPTYRWFPPAWSPAAGWPNRVAAHDGRLLFGRFDKFWVTRPSDINSLEVLNVTGEFDGDSAITAQLRPRKAELPWIEWAISAGGAVMLGLRDGERVLRGPNLFEALAIDTLRAIPGAKEGSAEHDPADVDDGVIFIGRDRKRLHFISYDALNEKMSTLEVTKSARHLLLTAKASDLAWQRDPNRVLWIACQDGSLQGLTFMPEDQVVAAHEHPLENGMVEWVESIPAADESTIEVYLGIQRTINGQTRRYVERLQDFFVPVQDEWNVDDDGKYVPTAEGAWLVDCGLEYIGTPATVISGLTHLIGQSVRVFADGAQQADSVVSSAGTITLAQAGSNVLVGLPVRGYVKTLPFELDTPQGVTKDKLKGAQHVLVECVQSAGGTVAVNGASESQIAPLGQLDYGALVPLADLQERVRVGSTKQERCTVEVILDNALPFTLTGVGPDMEVG